MKNTRMKYVPINRSIVEAARRLGPWLGQIENPLINEAEWEAVLKPLIGNNPDAANHLARFLFQVESALESEPYGIEWAKSTLRTAIEDIMKISESNKE